MIARRSRSVRPAKRSVRLVARDFDILEAVGRMGLTTTDQIARLFFDDSADTSTASRRLSKLASVHLLDVHVGRLDEQNVYVLAKRGIELLVQHDVDEASLHRSKANRGGDPHLRATNDLRVEFVLAERAGLLGVEAFHADLDLRRAARGTMPPYVPDAIIELAVGDEDVLALFAEIDTATESVATFAAKVRVTVNASEADAETWGFPAGSWIPIAIAPTPGRVRALARAIVREGGGDLWFLSEFTVLRQCGAAGSFLVRARDAAEVPRGDAIPYRGRLPRREPSDE